MRRLRNLIKNHSNWIGYIIFKFFKKKDLDFTFQLRTGMKITVPKRLMHTYKECFLDETYLKGLTKKGFGTKSPIVIDIGANVGYFSLHFFCKYPNAIIFALEPVPVNYQLLKTYKEAFANLNFSILNMAAGTKDEILVLHYDKKDSYTTAASIFTYTHQPDVIEVPAITLEHLLEKYQIDKVDLLKLDCEGAEYGILYKTSPDILNRIEKLAIETHLGNADNENTLALAEYLEKNNYSVKTQGKIIWAEKRN